jgi:hypothetical protein
MTQPHDGASETSRVAAEQGAEVRDAIRGQAGEIADSAREHAGEVVHSAKDETRQVVERTKRAVEDEARQRTDELAHAVRRMSEELRALADGRTDEAGPVVGYARDAASRVSDVAERLERRGYDGMLEDVADFGRRRPGVFLASAGLLGFAVGRVLRSGGASSSTGSASAPPARVASRSPDGGGRLPTPATSPVPADPWATQPLGEPR